MEKGKSLEDRWKSDSNIRFINKVPDNNQTRDQKPLSLPKQEPTLTQKFKNWVSARRQ